MTAPITETDAAKNNATSAADVPTGASDEAMPDAMADAEIADETGTTEEGAEAEAQTESGIGRRRNNRRGGRNRRGDKRAPAGPAAPENVITGAAEELVREPIREPVRSETPPAETSRGESGRESGRRNAPARPTARPTPPAPPPAPLLVPAPPPEPVVDTSVGAHLIARNGRPQIHINGVAYPPVLFFGNLEGAKNEGRAISEVKRAARAGVHLHSTLVELPCPLSEASHALDEIDDRIRALIDADSDGFVMPRIVFIPARGWKREYPTDIATYLDGPSSDASLTSERFWREAEHSLQTLISHLRGHEWGRRIFGYHLERGEWFQPMDSGYDRSIANRDAFRDWLREKYQNNLVGLRAAWYDSDVQFHTAEIPPLLAKPNIQRAFFETRRERRYIDFHEFTSESTANRLITLSQVVKRATDYQALVSVCYGYTLEFGHGWSGHLALSTILAAPTIDLVSGPPSYRDRKPSGAASLPVPFASLPLHGKLWLSEDDTKTYLAPTQQDPDDFNPRLPTKEATENAQARAIGRALAQETGVGWMDLWGEGWLDEDGLWERIKTFTERYEAELRASGTEKGPEGSRREGERRRGGNAPTARPSKPETRNPLYNSVTPDVVALIDEKSLLHIQRGEAFFRKLTNGLRDTLQRAGVSFGIYLQSDVLSDAFPLDAKLYLFLTPFRLPTTQRDAIKEKLQGGGRTLAWLYAPGACEERPLANVGMDEAASGIVGLALRQQAWNSEVGSRLVETNHPLTERIGGRDLGTRERLNPSFYVDDEDATTLAEYQGSGLASLAVRNHDDWKAVFVGDPALPLELLRGICRYAGVHVWVGGGEDVAYIGNGWVTLHASRDGQRTLRLPTPMACYDATEQRLVSEETREYRFFLRAGQTRTFAVGTIGHFEAMGLPHLTVPSRERFAPRPDNRPESRTENRELRDAPEMPETETSVQSDSPPVSAPVISLPPPVAAALFAPSTARPRHSIQEDLATLQAIVNMDLSDTEILEVETELDSDLSDELEETPIDREGEENGYPARRRRRRGGRGRGRRPDEGDSPDAPEASAAGETVLPMPDRSGDEASEPLAEAVRVTQAIHARIYDLPEPDVAEIISAPDDNDEVE